MMVIPKINVIETEVLEEVLEEVSDELYRRREERREGHLNAIETAIQKALNEGFKVVVAAPADGGNFKHISIIPGIKVPYAIGIE